MAVKIDLLSSFRGDREIYLEDVTPEEREKLGQTVQELLKQGHALFLIQGEESRRIQGYDQKTNEWLVLASPHPRPPRPAGLPEETETTANHEGLLNKLIKRKGRKSKDRIPAADTKVTGVAPSAGG